MRHHHNGVLTRRIIPVLSSGIEGRSGGVKYRIRVGRTLWER